MSSPGGAMKVSAEAWSARAVSLFQPGRNCASVVEAARASFLVDSEAYFRALRAACMEARESILILGWDFNSRTRLDHGEAAGRGAPPPGLGDFLDWLAKRRRGLRIHVLIWDFPMVFGAAREWPPIYGFGWRPHRRVKVRYDNTHPPGGSQHQKIVVIDDAVAFCGGIDLTARRWDSCSHPAQDARRTWDGKPYAPYHDVMAMVDGEAAAALGEVARERWRAATGRVLAAPRPGGVDPWPRDVTPQMTGALTAIARTIPETHPLGEAREIEALFLDMIAAAKDVIFIENQYFTSDRLGDALARRLAEDDPPEVVVVTRLLSHGWLEAGTMETLRTGLVRKLRDADHKGRFGIYTPHVAGLEQGTCVDVHSKVTVVDDQWLRIGSANFSNRSMGFDTECDVAFEAGGNRAHRGAIRDFRDVLIAEHLGVPVDEWRAALEAHGSHHAAIRRLQREDRTLKPLEDRPEPAAAMAAVAAVGDPERPVSLDLLVEQFSSDDAAGEPARRGPAWGTIAAFGVAVLAFALAWRYTPLAEYVTVDRVRGWANAARGTGWAPLAVVLAYVPASFVMFPRPLITMFGVVALGPLAGFGAAMTGVALSGACLYGLGRVMKRDTVRRIAGERLNRTAKLLRRHGLAASFACSIAPVAPFMAVGVVAGAMRVKLWQYLAGMLGGMAPGAAATTLFADQLAAALEDPARINWWIVAGVVAAFAALMLGAKRWLRRLEA